MMTKLKSLLEMYLPDCDPEQSPQTLLPLASAALMVEVRLSDYERKPDGNGDCHSLREIRR
ncbi:hypothetical protein Q4488_09840 [Amphritea sp. 1_MG-2023]|uniref:hypothetical protein n=1 Tax=Amphritea sp. 1_MG-2023 TaxID=3062670 RepID=UPI0026E13975|nr:hypothetical protein [Amphritea sp. 1_MG-2023]MDO6563685.1 hypothetical protein [Amphritea sp. 1_MG-2023]